MPVAYNAAEQGSGGPADFTLYCRGDVRLYRGAEDCTPKSKKGRALFAILAAEQRPLSRVKLIDLLWSNRQEEQARASLRTLLADLKSQFNSTFDDLLTVERERIALGPGVRTDLTDPTLARPAGELFEGLDHIDPELDEWLRVEREKWANGAASSPAATTTANRPSPARRFPRRALAAILLLLGIAAGALLYFRPWAEPEQPVLAVLKFNDLSGKNDVLANGLAEQLRIELSQYPDLQIVGGASSEIDILKGKDAQTIAKLLDATHLLEGRVVPADGQLQLTLRLTDGESGRALWQTRVEASGQAVLSGRAGIVSSVAELLSEVVSRAAPAEALAADADAWATLFKARSIMNYFPDKAQQARELLLPVLARYPRFAPALVTVSHATMEMAGYTYHGAPLSRDQARGQARPFAQRAIDVAPNYGPAHGAMAVVLVNTDEEVRYARRAVELSPGSTVALHNWASVLAWQGDWAGALEFHRRASQLDPLDMLSQWRHAEALVVNGRKTEARQVIAEYLSRSIPRDVQLKVIASSEIDLFGDWSRAFVAARQALKHAPEDTWNQRLNMWPSLLLYGAREARPFSGEEDSLPHLVLNDDLPAIVAKVDALGREFWNLGYETSAAAHYLLSRNRADTLVDAYDRARSGGMARDVLEFQIPELVIALRRVGRDLEAQRLVRLGEKRSAEQKGVSPQRAAIGWAITHALAGRTDAAIRSLGYAHENYWWTGSLILDHPYNLVAFEALRSDPRFVNLVRDYNRWVAVERREAIAQAKAARLPPPPTSPPPPFV